MQYPFYVLGMFLGFNWINPKNRLFFSLFLFVRKRIYLGTDYTDFTVVLRNHNTKTVKSV